MDDIISLIFFLVVIIVSVVSKLMKSGENSGSSTGTGGTGSSLKDIIKSIQNELTSDDSTSVSYENTYEEEDEDEARYNSLEGYDQEALFSELDESPAVSEEEKPQRNMPRSHLQNMVVWKEILDKPVSLR